MIVLVGISKLYRVGPVEVWVPDFIELYVPDG